MVDMTTRWAQLTDRAVLRLGGGDCRSFLQGLITNDVEQLSVGRAVYAALLTPQGKFLFDFHLYQDGDSILLDAAQSMMPDLVKRLSMYKLRSDVSIVPEPSLVIAAVWPHLSADVDAVVASDPRHNDLGQRVVGSAASIEVLANDCMAGDYDAHRLSLGIPDGVRDLIANKTILLEAGFDALDGVSFDKGCFVGQELTARTKYRGLVKRRLLSVDIEGDTPPPGTPVMAGETTAGEMRSAQGTVGLAMLRLDRIADQSSFACGDATLTLRQVDWQQLPQTA